MKKSKITIALKPDDTIRFDIDATIRECNEADFRNLIVMALLGVEGGESIRVPPPPQIPLEEAVKQTVNT